MSKRSKKRAVIGKLFADSFEFPYEGIESIPVIELKGREEAYISGCSSIVEYDSSVVVFDAKRYQITIRGENLILTDFLLGSVCVTGLISGINID